MKATPQMTSPIEMGTSNMKSTLEADDGFLRRILFVLILSATVTGAIAAYTAVSAAQTGLVNLTVGSQL
jgi:hypothetical protein